MTHGIGELKGEDFLASLGDEQLNTFYLINVALRQVITVQGEKVF